MKLYLVHPSAVKTPIALLEKSNPPYILSSYYYLKDQMDVYEWVKSNCKGFLLDSGAFTFMSKKTSPQVNWLDYIKDYAKFILDNDIKLYFELDIDSVIGVDQTLKLRRKLEHAVGYPSIPVWHKCRGKQAFLDMVRDYDYVAIGGIASKEISKKQYGYFKPLVDFAHRHDAKVHALGLSAGALLLSSGFDSSDSKSWTRTRWGQIAMFTGTEIKTVSRQDARIRIGWEPYIHDITEYAKYSRYLDKM